MKTENIEKILEALKHQSEFCQWNALLAADAELAAFKKAIKTARRKVIEECINYIRVDWFDSEGMLIAVDGDSFLDDIRNTFIEQVKEEKP